MFLVQRALYNLSLILQTPKLYLAVTCTVVILTKRETIQIKKGNTKIHYKNCGLPSRKDKLRQEKLKQNKKLFYQVYGTLYHTINSFISIQPLGRFGRNQSPVRRPVWLWHAASWARSQGQVAIVFPLRQQKNIYNMATKKRYIKAQNTKLNEFHFNLHRNTKLILLPLTKELWRTAGYTRTTL